MTCALLGRTPGRCWSSTSGCAASAPLRPSRIRRTWLRPTRMPSAWAASARASRVQCAGASGWAGRQQPLAALVQPAGRRRAGQGDDPAALVLAEAPGPPGPGQVASPSMPLALKRCSHLETVLGWQPSRWATLGDAGAVPAGGDDAGALDPAGGRVPAGGELAQPALFGGVDGWSGVQEYRHGVPPVPLRTTRLTHGRNPHTTLRNAALGELPVHAAARCFR